MNPTTGILLIGVALAGYSAYLSYTYLRRSRKEGLGVFEGWTALKDFYDHTAVNFVGAIATLVALQAQVGICVVVVLIETHPCVDAVAVVVHTVGCSARFYNDAKGGHQVLFHRNTSLVLLPVASIAAVPRRPYYT